ncbi:MAG TPA: aldehyde dehydrogenase family protein, partial [Steroidobacteraceae bacterium]
DAESRDREDRSRRSTRSISGHGDPSLQRRLRALSKRYFCSGRSRNVPTTQREAIGVAGMIVPWNSPLVLLLRALAPALAAGCTAVITMPSQSAVTSGLIADAMAATSGLPAGVVNLFTESGRGCQGTTHDAMKILSAVPVVTSDIEAALARYGALTQKTVKEQVARFGRGITNAMMVIGVHNDSTFERDH